MKYLLGVDLGTSATKTAIFNQSGQCIASSAKEYPLEQPENGWAEQNPGYWWDACVSTLKQVIEKSGVDPNDIAGIGLSGQMHGLVMLDENGEVLRNSILWCDSRTTVECEEITRIVGAERLIEITANPALEGFTAGKILWVKKHQPELYARCRKILLPKDYLRYKLCGVYATEVSDASGMNLLDVPKRCWSDEVLSKLNIEPSLLPKVYESCEITGTVTSEVAGITGLKAGTPVVGGAADNAAAAIGTGVVETGKAFTTIGTSGVIFAHSDKVAIDPAGRVHSFCSAVTGKWTVMSCTLAAGGSLQWFRNQFCSAEVEVAAGLGQDPYVIMDMQAKRVPIGANRLIFLPYLMGERSPLLDANARGVFLGLSGIHTRYDMLRAVMEGVVYSLRNCLDVFVEMGINFTQMLATGGGGNSPLWRQMMADLYECPICTVDNKEGPALGAAILAGVGTGIYESAEDACKKILKTSEPQIPVAENTSAYMQYYQIYLQLYKELENSFKNLAKLK